MKATDSTTSRQGRGTRPFADLEALFEALPDSELLSTLEATRHTGRPGYPIEVVWRTLVASFSLGIYRKLNAIRTRRMPKVWLHVALSVIAMNVSASVMASAGGQIRRCVA